MNRVFSIFCCISLLYILNSCSIERSDSNFNFTVLETVSADFPEAFEINETYDIDVVLLRPDSCSFFEGFEVTSPELTTRVIAAVGTVLTNQECSVVLEEITTTITFRIDYPGPYLFRFFIGVDELGNPLFQEYEVPVNQ